MKQTEPDRAKPGRSDLLDLFLLGIAGIGLRLSLSQAMRSHAATPGSGAVWGLALGAVVCALLFLVSFLRIARRKEDLWGWYPGVVLLFILLYEFQRYRPEIAPMELPLALFFFLPAGILAWLFVRRIRQADELQRRILSESLGLSFVVTLIATFLYALLEGMEVLHLPSIWVAVCLVVSLSLGLVLASRRYQ